MSTNAQPPAVAPDLGGSPTVPEPRKKLALLSEALRRRLDPAELPFETTAEVEPLATTVGQPRAMEAIAFGIAVQSRGYNLFVAGTPGSGRETLVRAHLEPFARTRPPPPDWIYVHDFAQPDRPRAIRLPPGRGSQLARDMREFVHSARRDIPRAFDSEEYDRRRHEALADIVPRRDELLDGLRAFARAEGFDVEVTETGMATIPLDGDQPISDEDFGQLPVDRRRAIEQRNEMVREHATATLRELRHLEKDAADRVQQLDADVARFAIGPLVDDLRQKYASEAEVLTYLAAVQSDLIEHLEDFRNELAQRVDNAPRSDAEALKSLMESLEEDRPSSPLGRYRVNVLVDHARSEGAPVVFEPNPTYANLLGRIEYRARLGAMVTDFEQIKPGALHRANGGFLVLKAIDLLSRPLAWDLLKRSLIAGTIRIETLAEEVLAPMTATLTPEPIPLDVKVILIGPPEIYQALHHVDDDFRDLFKVKVDFAVEMDWNAQTVHSYSAFLARCVARNGLRHFDRGAVARIIEHGARMREHQERLSTRLRQIADLAIEASHWAGQADHAVVQASDVDLAIRKRRYRSNLAEEQLARHVAEGTLVIETQGRKVGQVNGIAVLDLGDHVFGRPSRITASVSVGRGALVSVERATRRSGPSHSKGIFTISGYLRAIYAQRGPLSVHATVAFEQSYDEIDGDSASSAELYALLSALSGVPVDQGIAVTGAVDQRGVVQAVGGIAEKIEGFFAICKARGLDGRQGVIVPATNARHLMLDDEVVEAVRERRFHVWAVRSIDEGISLLMGLPAGERRADGRFPEGSVHGRVEARLREFAEHARATNHRARAALEPRPRAERAATPQAHGRAAPKK